VAGPQCLCLLGAASENVPKTRKLTILHAASHQRRQMGPGGVPTRGSSTTVVTAHSSQCWQRQRKDGYNVDTGAEHTLARETTLVLQTLMQGSVRLSRVGISCPSVLGHPPRWMGARVLFCEVFLSDFWLSGGCGCWHSWPLRSAWRLLLPVSPSQAWVARGRLTYTFEGLGLDNPSEQRTLKKRHVAST
jgi:hypothetical protein